MSTDRAPEIVRIYQVQYPNLILLDNPGKIVPIGLNCTTHQERGEIIFSVDVHTINSHDNLTQYVAALQSSDADNVGGRMDVVGNTLLGEVVAIATTSPFVVGGACFHYSYVEECVDTVYMGVWRLEVFEKIGLFDEENSLGPGR